MPRTGARKPPTPRTRAALRRRSEHARLLKALRWPSARAFALAWRDNTTAIVLAPRSFGETAVPVLPAASVAVASGFATVLSGWRHASCVGAAVGTFACGACAFLQGCRRCASKLRALLDSLMLPGGTVSISLVTITAGGQRNHAWQTDSWSWLHRVSLACHLALLFVVGLAIGWLVSVAGYTSTTALGDALLVGTLLLTLHGAIRIERVHAAIQLASDTSHLLGGVHEIVQRATASSLRNPYGLGSLLEPEAVQVCQILEEQCHVESALATCRAIYQQPFRTRDDMRRMKTHLRLAIARRLCDALCEAVRTTLSETPHQSLCTLCDNPYEPLEEAALRQVQRVWELRLKTFLDTLDTHGFEDNVELHYSKSTSGWYTGIDRAERTALPTAGTDGRTRTINHSAPVLSADIIKAQFSVGLHVLCGFGWSVLQECFGAALVQLKVKPGTDHYKLIKQMQKTLAHVLMGKLLKSTGLLATLHMENATKLLIRRFAAAIVKDVPSLVDGWSPESSLGFNLCADEVNLRFTQPGTAAANGSESAGVIAVRKRLVELSDRLVSVVGVPTKVYLNAVSSKLDDNRQPIFLVSNVFARPEGATTGHRWTTMGGAIGAIDVDTLAGIARTAEVASVGEAEAE